MYKEEDAIKGVLIIKIGHLKNKICTIFVDPESRLQGVGYVLLQESLFMVQGDTIITVPEEKYLDLLNLLTKFNFTYLKCHSNRYRAGRKEFVFKRCG
ncbi:MAG: hypothetical protein CME61_00465 [Halobacteriovoraceae bacterium]|nr:hypothetical protein [Halobacteriovoraceae bacterium]